MAALVPRKTTGRSMRIGWAAMAAITAASSAEASEGFVGGFAAAEKLLCREAEGFEGCANLGLVGLILQVEADLWCQPALIQEGEGLARLGAAGVVPDGQVHVSRPLPTASATLA